MKKQEITERILTYEDACKVLGIEPIDEQKFIECGFRLADIARRKIETITEALNEGWKADYEDGGQCKYLPYFYYAPSGFAFCNTYSLSSLAGAGDGSRLCFKTSALAEYAGTQFTELYKTALSWD